MTRRSGLYYSALFDREFQSKYNRSSCREQVRKTCLQRLQGSGVNGIDTNHLLSVLEHTAQLLKDMGAPAREAAAVAAQAAIRAELGSALQAGDSPRCCAWTLPTSGSRCWLRPSRAVLASRKLLTLLALSTCVHLADLCVASALGRPRCVLPAYVCMCCST